MDSRQIVVGIDGSESSWQALMWAAHAAAVRRVPLITLHAGSAETAHGLWRQADAFVKERFADARCVPELAETTAAQALIAASDHAALIVVGRRGRGALPDLLLGSTSLQVSMHAHCPVAVVRGNTAQDGPIVVGVDSSPHSQGALEYAFLEANLTGRPVLALHVYASGLMGYPDALIPVPDAETEHDQATELLARELLPWQEAFPDVRTEQQAVPGSPAHILVPRTEAASVVVVGSRGLGGFAGLLLGSTGQALVHHARCPVVIARLRAGAHGAWAHLPS
ncbi:universal stress protein [Catelliglobosispora koreensis]|uniref:universal stress protein n=1 Tax=Catelliglobosispora koreensis TaxID=129052 RepID=UPI000366A7E0|nr:universal stress protein [Catelliglobosispora koreensis]